MVNGDSYNQVTSALTWTGAHQSPIWNAENVMNITPPTKRG